MKFRNNITIKWFATVVQVIVITVLLAYVFTLIFHHNKTVKIWGFEFSIVQSSSMSPNIKLYDFVVIVNSVNNIKEKDIIVFFDDANKNKVIHRVIEIVEEDGQVKYITKGDNNKFADAGVRTHSDIYAKYLFTIPLLGYFISFLTSTLGMASLLLNSTVLLVIMFLWTLEKPDFPTGCFK